MKSGKSLFKIKFFYYYIWEIKCLSIISSEKKSKIHKNKIKFGVNWKIKIKLINLLLSKKNMQRKNKKFQKKSLLNKVI